MTQTQWRHNWNQSAAKQKGNYLSQANKISAVKKYKQQTYEVLSIKEGDYILEIGCGVGDDAIAMAEQAGSSGKIIAIDVEQGMIEQAIERTKDLELALEFRQGNVCNLDFEDNQFDGCRTDRALQHLKNPHQALAEMVRVVRPEGQLVVSEPDWGTLVVDSRTDHTLTRKILNYWADTRKSGWIGRQLPGLFEECGLVNIEVQSISISGVMRNYDWEFDFIAIAKSAEGAKNDGLITLDEAHSWLQNLKEAEKIGRFFAHLGGFMVSGQKQ